MVQDFLKYLFLRKVMKNMNEVKIYNIISLDTIKNYEMFE